MADDRSFGGKDCVNNQKVDRNGQVVRDANGDPVPCGGWMASTAEDPGWFGGDQALYLGAGALLIGGGIAAAVVTSSSNNNGGGGSSQQNQLFYTLLLNNNRNPNGPLGGSPASP